MVYILNIQLGRCRAVSVYVVDVEVNFRPRNYKMSESVSADGWVGHSGVTMGLWRPLLAVIIVSHQYLPSIWGQKINDSHNMIGDHFMSYA